MKPLALGLGLLLVLLLALPAASSSSAAVAARVAGFAPLHSARRTATPLMKGRPVGGGPAIRTRKQKKRLAAALVPTRPGEQTSSKRKKVARFLSRGRQWQRFSAIVRQGAEPWPVFVRAVAASSDGGEEWLEVGQVSVTGATPERLQQSVALQKRLILEHAKKLHPLSMRDADLECGMPRDDPTSPPEPLTCSAVSSSSARPEQGNAHAQRAPAVEGDSTILQPSECGFLGKPAGRTGHYYAASEMVQSTGKKVKLERMGIDSKSATAEQFSKQLGLRSG